MELEEIDELKWHVYNKTTGLKVSEFEETETEQLSLYLNAVRQNNPDYQFVVFLVHTRTTFTECERL